VRFISLQTILIFAFLLDFNFQYPFKK